MFQIHENNRLAIAYVMVATASFILNDTFTKLASEQLSTGQIILVRGMIASPMIILLAWWRGAFRNLPLLFHKTVGFRTSGEVFATACYLTALFNMPIANASAILQTVPLAATAGAAIFLGEKVGVRRWTAIAIGLVGVLIIIRPGTDGFTVWSLFALAAVGGILARDLSSRAMPRGIPVLGAAAVSAVSVTCLGAVMTLFGEWHPVSTRSLVYLCTSAVFLLFAISFMQMAMRSGEISAVAPFRYSILLWAIIIQITVFGVWPDAPMLFGSTILVAMGLYTFYRERVIASDTRSPTVAANPQVPDKSG